MAPKLQITLTATTPRQIHITRQLRKNNKSNSPQSARLSPMNKGISPFTSWVLFTRIHGRPLTCTGIPVSAPKRATRSSTLATTPCRSSLSKSLAFTNTIIKLALVLSLKSSPS